MRKVKYSSEELKNEIELLKRYFIDTNISAPRAYAIVTIFRKHLADYLNIQSEKLTLKEPIQN